MYQITQEISFCYGHRLLEYAGKCGRLHGHNGIAQITLRAEALDAHGMVADFDAIEKVLRAFIDEAIDHRMLLHRDDPALPALRALGEPLCEVAFNPTAENIARMIFDRAAEAGFPVAEVRVVEVPGSTAAYAR